MNQTIPASIRKWFIDVENKFYYKDKKYSYILVDFSDPTYLNNCINLNEVVEVFDHHYGYENFWKEKIGVYAKIERVGASATLIWEEFKKSNMETKISFINANLLYTAIFSNTLNFKSVITTERDQKSASELFPFTKLPKKGKNIL